MNKQLQFFVVFSVCFSLIFFGLMLSGNEQIVSDASNLNISSWVPPMRTISYESLIKQTRKLENPFKKKLYEELKLRGFYRQKNGKWSAVLQCPDGKPLSICSGQTCRGITVLKMDQNSCKIQAGEVIRTLKID